MRAIDTGLPTLIPGPLAAQEAGVAPATIRKWVHLGRLTAAGKAGRAALFRLEDVFAAERAAARRPALLPPLTAGDRPFSQP